MSDLNYCRRQGYLVSASYWYPSDPGEFCPPGAIWIVGCTQLVCCQCGSRVRSESGFFEQGDANHAALIFRTQDWRTLKCLSHKPAWVGYRFYTCKCESHTEGDARPLDNSQDDWPVPSWKCSGHPLAVYGGRYYGVEVDKSLKWDELVEKAFAGWLPPDVWPETEPPWQAIWIRGLYRRLLGTPMAESLARAVAGFLTHPDPMWRALALRFFYGIPSAPGGERLLELASGDRLLFQGFANPFPTEEPDLEAWLIAAIGRRLAVGSESGDGQRHVPDRDDLLGFARIEVLRPGKAAPLIRGLSHADTEWLIAHAPQVAEGSPAVAGEILVEIDQTGSDVHLIAARMAQVPGIDVSPMRQTVKKYFEDETRRKTLAAISKAARMRKPP